MVNVTYIGNDLRTQLPPAKDVTSDIVSPLIDVDSLTEVNQPIEPYKRLSKVWRMTDALIDGTDAMRKAGRDFLPQEPAETNRSYDNRLKRSVLFGAFKKTCTTLTGRPFSRMIQFEKFNPSLEALNDNIDLNGNNIHVFSRNRFMMALCHGHSFILIDHPKRPDIEGRQSDLPSLEDERSMLLRPYWRAVNPQDVIGWQTEILSGREVLTQVRIKERITKKAGRYGIKETERIRVIEPGHFWILEKEATGNWIQVDQGSFIDASGREMKIIPLVPFYPTIPNAFYETTPPLIDLAHLNVLHWQSSSDQQNILHVARVPILFLTGMFDDDDLEIGSSRWIKGPTGSDMKYVEHTGAAIQAGRDSLEDLENQMRIMGAEILVRDPARVTATQKILDTDEATSELQDMVIRFEDALAQCYAITARWMGLDENAVGSIEIYKDFGISAAAFQEAQILLQMRLSRQITQDTYLREIKRRGILSDELNIEKELELTKIETDEVRQQNPFVQEEEPEEE